MANLILLTGIQALNERRLDRNTKDKQGFPVTRDAGSYRGR
jgi:hypothetical protein